MYSSDSSLAAVEAASRAASRAREGWGWVHRGARGGGQLGQDAARGGADGLAGRGVGADGGQQSRGDAVGLGKELNEQVRRLDLGVAGRSGGLHGPGDRLL